MIEGKRVAHHGSVGRRCSRSPLRGSQRLLQVRAGIPRSENAASDEFFLAKSRPHWLRVPTAGCRLRATTSAGRVREGWQPTIDANEACGATSSATFVRRVHAWFVPVEAAPLVSPSSRRTLRLCHPSSMGMAGAMTRQWLRARPPPGSAVAFQEGRGHLSYSTRRRHAEAGSAAVAIHRNRAMSRIPGVHRRRFLTAGRGDVERCYLCRHSPAAEQHAYRGAVRVSRTWLVGTRSAKSHAVACKLARWNTCDSHRAGVQAAAAAHQRATTRAARRGARAR